MSMFNQVLIMAVRDAVKIGQKSDVYCWVDGYTASVTIPKERAIVLQDQGLRFCADPALNSQGTSTYEEVDMETATAMVIAGAMAIAGWLNNDPPDDGAIEARKTLLAAAFPGKLECQLLYNLRVATGWISGNDLNELFLQLVDEPSPSGYKLFEEDDLARLDSEVHQMLQDPLLRQAAEARNDIEAEFWAMVWDVKYDPRTKAYFEAVHAQSGLSCDPEYQFTELAKWARKEFPEPHVAYKRLPYEFRSHRRFVGWF